MIQNFSYGKSGGQGISPLIVVTAPTGSTVTCDGVQGTEVSGTWTFPVIIGTHTIVATKGENTKTETVLVDSVAVFSITIKFRTYLYNQGTVNTALTGGLSKVYYNSGYLTVNSDNLVMGTSNTGSSYGWRGGFVTNSKMSFTTDQSIGIEFVIQQQPSSGTGYYILGTTTACQGVEYRHGADVGIINSSTSTGACVVGQTYSFVFPVAYNVSNVYFIIEFGKQSVSGAAASRVNKVWLE